MSYNQNVTKHRLPNNRNDLKIAIINMLHISNKRKT